MGEATGVDDKESRRSWTGPGEGAGAGDGTEKGEAATLTLLSGLEPTGDGGMTAGLAAGDERATNEECCDKGC